MYCNYMIFQESGSLACQLLLWGGNKPLKGADMKEEIKKSGLCVNCMHVDTCAFVSNQSKPIIYCEEFLFDEFQRQLGSKTCENQPTAQKIETGDLCINCDNSKTCFLVKTENGQIYCEEYK